MGEAKRKEILALDESSWTIGIEARNGRVHVGKDMSAFATPMGK